MEEEEEEEGLLEVKGHTGWHSEMGCRIDTEAYGDTAEQLSQALAEVPFRGFDGRQWHYFFVLIV